MRIGIDLGGTKTEIICLDADSGEEMYRKRVNSPRNDYPETIKTIAALIFEAEQNLDQIGSVGVGIPGCISRQSGLVKNANSDWQNGKPLKKDLEQALKRDVRVENDANCFAVSEAVDGAAAGAEIVFAVIIGTGCGAGISIAGKPVEGLNGLGGEWGHNPLPLPKIHESHFEGYVNNFPEGIYPNDKISARYEHKDLPKYTVSNELFAEYPGFQCYCGKRGCLETWISGPAFESDYKRVNGEALSSKQIVSRSKDGDQKAIKTIERYTDRLARGLAGIVDILDPDVIVLGGGMSNLDTLYADLPKIWNRYIFSTEDVLTEIRPAKHGDSSGVRGAAWLWNKG